MCYCILICFPNNRCFALRSAFALPCRIRIDFSLILDPRPVRPRPPHPFCRDAGDLNTITFQKGRDGPGPGLGCEVTSRASHLPLQTWWPQGWLEGQAVAEGPLSCVFFGKVLKRALCALSMGWSASSFYPLLFPLLPMDLQTGEALPSLLEKVLDFPLLAKAPLFLAGCWKLEGSGSSASGCQTEMDGEPGRSLR